MGCCSGVEVDPNLNRNNGNHNNKMGGAGGDASSPNTAGGSAQAGAGTNANNNGPNSSNVGAGGSTAQNVDDSYRKTDGAGGPTGSATESPSSAHRSQETDGHHADGSTPTASEKNNALINSSASNNNASATTGSSAAGGTATSSGTGGPFFGPQRGAPNTTAVASLIPQEFAQLRDIFGEMSKMDMHLKRRVRIEPEWVHWEPRTGQFFSPERDQPPGAGAAGTWIKLRKASVVTVEEKKIERLAQELAKTVLKHHSKLSTSRYFQQPMVMIYEEGLPSTDNQHQKYTGLPTIAAADRSQDLSGVHAVVSAIELFLVEPMRFIAGCQIWHAPPSTADDQDDGSMNHTGSPHADSPNGRAAAYGRATVSGSGGVTMDNLVETLMSRMFTAQSYWRQLPDPGTAAAAARGGTSSSNAPSSSSMGNNPSSPAQMHFRFQTCVQTEIRVLFLALGGTEFSGSPNEHGVPHLPALDMLVALLLRNVGPILKARSPNRNRLRSEVRKWLRLLAFLGVVAEHVVRDDALWLQPNYGTGRNSVNDTNASPFSQLPVFLLTPAAVSQLLLIDTALRANSMRYEKQPPRIQAPISSQQDMLESLLKDNIVPSSLADLRPYRDASVFNTIRYTDGHQSLVATASLLLNDSNSASVIPGSPGNNSLGEVRWPYGYPQVPADFEIAAVPSPSDYELSAADSIADFFNTVARPYFGVDSRFGVARPPPLALFKLFKSMHLEYCVLPEPTLDFGDPTMRDDDPLGGKQTQRPQETLTPFRLVLEQPLHPSVMVQMAAVDEGDTVVLDPRDELMSSYPVLQREFKMIDDAAERMVMMGDAQNGALPHALFTPSAGADGAGGLGGKGAQGGTGRITDYKVVVLHFRMAFEPPPFATKRETLDPSVAKEIEVRMHFARCLFAAPSVDYATFVVSNQLQSAGDEVEQESFLDNSSESPARVNGDGSNNNNNNNIGDGGGGNSENMDGGAGGAFGAGGGGGGGAGEQGRSRSGEDILRQQQIAYMLGWLVASAIASGVTFTVPLPALMFRVLKTFVRRAQAPQGASGSTGAVVPITSGADDDTTHHCLFQASEADVLEMMPRISAVIDDIRRLSTMRFIELVRMEGLGSIMTKDEYITSIIAEQIVFPLSSYTIYEAIFTGMYDSGLVNSPLWAWSSPLTQQRVVTATCLEDDDRNAPDFVTRDWDIRVGFMPFQPDAQALEDKFSEVVEGAITSLSPIHKRELLRKSLGLLRPPAGSDHIFSVTVAIGSLELVNRATRADFDEELHETPFVRPVDNILRVPNYLEAMLFHSDGLYWNWFPHKVPSLTGATDDANAVPTEVLDSALNDIMVEKPAQMETLTEQVQRLTAERIAAFLIPQRAAVVTGPASSASAAEQDAFGHNAMDPM